METRIEITDADKLLELKYLLALAQKEHEAKQAIVAGTL